MATTKLPPAKQTPERRATPSAAAARTAVGQRIHIEDTTRTEWAVVEPAPISPDQRRHMIRDAAYFRAERRGFVNGDPTQDWLEAEKDVDRLLEGSGR